MPDIMPDKIDTFLDSPDTTTPASTNSTTFTPRTDAQMPTEATSGFFSKSPIDTSSSEQRFQDRNISPGVPLDTGGVGLWDRLMVESRINKQNQIKFLEGKYGKDTVRMSDEGDLIVRVPGDEGKSKDVTVKPKSMKASDAVAAAIAIPEIAGWVFGEGAMVKIGGKTLEHLPAIVRGAAKLIGGSVGAETTGAITKDIPANVYDRGTLGLSDIGAQRGKNAIFDFGLGTVTKTAANFFQWTKNPANMYRGQVQFDAIKAQDYFKSKYGVSVPLTIGESTGMPLASRAEVFVEKMPGGSEPIRALKKTQESSLRKLQTIMMGEGSQTDEEFGNKVIQQIQTKIEPTVSKVTTATSQLAQGAQQNIEGIVAGTTLPERELYKTKLGEDIRTQVIGRRNAVKAEADRLYGVVKSLPGGEGKVFSGAGLQADFQKILKSLPSSEKTVEQPSALVDQFGNEIKTSSTEIAPLKEFVPPNVLSRLQSVIGIKDAKFSLSDLQQMRREVYDDIAKGEGVPGLGTHYLADIGKVLTKAIDDGVSGLPKGDLKTALGAANDFYKNKVVPFNRQGLTELFRTADEPGHISDSEVVSRLLGGTKATRNWELMKETLGESSPEFNRMRRSVADNILESSRLPGEETIDAKSLVKNLSDFQSKYREISDQVFGKDISKLFTQAKYLSYAQGDKIGASDLQSLLKSKQPIASNLKSLVAAERDRDELYKNQLVKSIGSGELTEQTLRPADFVNRVLDSSSPSEVNTVMKLIGDNPELVQQLRQKTFQKIFSDASRAATADDINLIMSGERTHILSGVKIGDALKNPNYQQKIKSILGTEGFQDLDGYVKMQASIEKKETSFAAAGGLAAGAQISGLERRGLFAYLGTSVRNFIFATILSRPPLRNWLVRMPEEPGKWSLIFSSPPFIEAVTKEFGKGSGADAFMMTLKRAVDSSFTSKGQSEESSRPSGLVNVRKTSDADINAWLDSTDKTGRNQAVSRSP